MKKGRTSRRWGAPSLRASKKSIPDPDLPGPSRRPSPVLRTVVHVEFNRMGCHAEAREFFMFQGTVGVEHVVGKHTALGQEVTILVEVLEGHLQGRTNLLDLFRLRRGQKRSSRFVRPWRWPSSTSTRIVTS